MRALFITLSVVVVLLIAAVFVGPSLIPTSVYRDQIAAAVEGATGRDFDIKGGIKLSVFPSVKARIQNASLGNAPGGKAPTMAEIGELDVGLALLPLLSRRAEIKSFVLNDAVIHLEVAKDGKPNWEFESAQKQNTPASGSSNSGLSQISLGDVRLVNGLLTYDDLKTGDSKKLEQINAKIALPSLDETAKIDGDAIYNAQKLDIHVELAKPRATLDHGTSALSLKVEGTPLSAAFNGDATFGEKLTLAGDTKLTVPSVRALAGWLGSPIEGGTGFGPLTLAGKVTFTGDDFAFDNADIQFDDTHATGNLKGVLTGKVPAISGALKADTLDMRPYLPESKPAGGTSSGSGTAASWSTEPIDASALKGFNANLAFTADKILVRDLTIGKSVIGLGVKTGVLTADLKEMALYGGAGKGVITLDASGARTRLGSNLSLTGLDLQPFLHDFAKTDKLSGKGTFTVNAQGSGASQRDIVSSLAGTAAINFKDGAIKGVDLVKIARAVDTLLGKKKTDQAATQTEANQEAAAAQGDDEATKFVAMGGNFSIANGILTTSDLKMLNELISVSGSGSINLVQQTIDMRLDPGRNQNDGGLKVGVLVRGPLSKPKFTPDMSGLIKNELNKVLDDLRDGGKKKPPPPAPGETSAPEQTEQPDPAKDAAKELLKGIFGGN